MPKRLWTAVVVWEGREHLSFRLLTIAAPHACAAYRAAEHWAREHVPPPPAWASGADELARQTAHWPEPLILLEEVCADSVDVDAYPMQAGAAAPVSIAALEVAERSTVG